MGRILFVSFYDLNRLMFSLPLSSGNCGPFVRRKDLGKFRSSLPAEPAVCKALLILLHCAGSCALASRSFVTTETHCLVPGTGGQALGSHLVKVFWMAAQRQANGDDSMSPPHPQGPPSRNVPPVSTMALGILCAPCRCMLGHIQHRLAASRTVHFGEMIIQPLHERVKG